MDFGLINPLISALQKMVMFLEKNKIDYMIIGGVANSFYGNPRQTFDIDIKFDLMDNQLRKFLDGVTEIAHPAVPDPLQFLRETAVLPVDADKIRIDLIRCGLSYERDALARAVRKEVLGLRARVCTVEDLIIQKAISPRDKDWMDIGAMITLHHKNLDWKYLQKHLKELAVFLDDQDIWKRIEKIKNEH